MLARQQQLMIRTPMAVNTASKGAVNLALRHGSELEGADLIAQVHQQVAGLLGSPCTGGMGGDARQAHAPGVVLDEEQDIQAAQEHRVDVEEVRRHDGVSLGGQERAPGRAAPVGCGVDSGVAEDLPDGRTARPCNPRR